MSRSDPSAVQAFLPLRPVELHVLLSLGGGPRHGYGIIQDAEERTGKEVIPDVGTLYRALRRMVETGLIEAVEAPSGEADPRRNHYGITTLGRRVAAAESARLAALVEAARAGGFLRGTGGA